MLLLRVTDEALNGDQGRTPNDSSFAESAYRKAPEKTKKKLNKQEINNTRYPIEFYIEQPIIYPSKSQMLPEGYIISAVVSIITVCFHKNPSHFQSVKHGNTRSLGYNRIRQRSPFGFRLRFQLLHTKQKSLNREPYE